jgi:glycosyltransferase involved in cell wall biosynthesis
MKDVSVNIATKLKEKYEFSLIFNEKNIKQSKSRNIAISKSNSKYILCLDADDKIPNNYIEENIKTLELGYDISYNNSKCFGDSVVEYNWPEYDIHTLRRTPFIHCSAIYNRIVWCRSKYDERMNDGWEDYAFWLSAASNMFTFKKSNSTKLFYRIKNDGVSNSANNKLETTIKPYLRNKYKGFYLG